MTKTAGLLRVSITKNVTMNVTKVYEGWLQNLFQKRAKFLKNRVKQIFSPKLIPIFNRSMKKCDDECDKSS